MMLSSVYFHDMYWSVIVIPDIHDKIHWISGHPKRIRKAKPSSQEGEFLSSLIRDRSLTSLPLNYYFCLSSFLFYFVR